MMSFKTEIEQLFKEVIGHYQMRVVPFDESEVLLVGRGFALSVSYDRGGVEIGYIELVTGGVFVLHRITNMLGMHRFLPDDRKLFGNPANTVEDQVGASLRVIASGLTNRCADILSGDKTWLNVLRKKDPTLWKGHPVSTKLLTTLQSVFVE